MTKPSDTSKGSDSTGNGWVIGVGAVVLWGAALAVWDWWVANPAVRTVLIWVFSVVGILHVAALVVVVWARRSGGAVGRGGVSGGWERGEREVFAVVPVVGGSRKRPPVLGTHARRVPALEFWPVLLRQADGLSSSERVVRALWGRDGNRLVWGVSVDRDLGAGAQRAAGSVWPAARVDEWPLDGREEVSDCVPIEEGGGTVVRCYLVPEDPSRPLHTPSGVPDHPMARVWDVLSAHPDVDVELRVDLVPLSPQERDRACSDRGKSLGEHDPDRVLWETEEHQARVGGVRVLLRVARAGAGHAAECESVAAQVCRVLNMFWSTDYNQLVVRKNT